MKSVQYWPRQQLTSIQHLYAYTNDIILYGPLRTLSQNRLPRSDSKGSELAQRTSL
jgi:hypothetical protein